MTSTVVVDVGERVELGMTSQPHPDSLLPVLEPRTVFAINTFAFALGMRARVVTEESRNTKVEIARCLYIVGVPCIHGSGFTNEYNRVTLKSSVVIKT
jgi:hypothetical protein